MKTLLWVYIAGAILTKIAIRGTAGDTAANVITWPALWLQNPTGMLNALTGPTIANTAVLPVPKPPMPAWISGSGEVIYSSARDLCSC
jgi:hypothetical protein